MTYAELETGLSAKLGNNNIARANATDVYAVFHRVASGKLVMFKGVGGNFTRVDDGNAPVADSDAVAMSLDDGNLLQIIYRHEDDVKYVTFNVSNDTWGTPENIVAGITESTHGKAVAIASDEGGDPHVIYSKVEAVGGDDGFDYANKIIGSWSIVDWDAIRSSSSFEAAQLPDISFAFDDVEQLLVPLITIGEARISDDFRRSREYFGNLLNATSFVAFGSSSNQDFTGVSIAIDRITVCDAIRERWNRVGVRTSSTTRQADQSCTSGGAGSTSGADNATFVKSIFTGTGIVGKGSLIFISKGGNLDQLQGDDILDRTYTGSVTLVTGGVAEMHSTGTTYNDFGADAFSDIVYEQAGLWKWLRQGYGVNGLTTPVSVDAILVVSPTKLANFSADALVDVGVMTNTLPFTVDTFVSPDDPDQEFEVAEALLDYLAFNGDKTGTELLAEVINPVTGLPFNHGAIKNSIGYLNRTAQIVGNPYVPLQSETGAYNFKKTTWTV